MTTATLFGAAVACGVSFGTGLVSGILVLGGPAEVPVSRHGPVAASSVPSAPDPADEVRPSGPEPVVEDRPGDPVRTPHPERPAACPVAPAKGLTAAELEATVIAAIEKDRRLQKRKQAAMQQGPYGQHNYMINYVSEMVGGMTGEQKECYAECLKRQQEMQKDLAEQYGRQGWNAERYQSLHAEIQGEMHDRMRRVLTEEQYEDFSAVCGVRSPR